jgi:hypothetical protein
MRMVSWRSLAASACAAQRDEGKVAAAAWGHVYRADCVDAASLTSFIIEHYAKGPENFCVPGQVF